MKTVLDSQSIIHSLFNNLLIFKKIFWQLTLLGCIAQHQ